MSQDGICEVEPGLFSMTMAFTDVNFQIAMLEEQKNIFTKYSEFLNYFDPSLHLEINLVTRSMDEEQFRRDTFLPLRGDDRDRYAEEMNQVVAEKALRGQNGLIREKYVTFSLHAENYQQAKEQLENRAADIADHFKRMGSSTRILSGIERLSLLQGIMRPSEEMSFSYDWLLAEDMFPSTPTAEHYKSVLDGGFMGYVKNSLFLAVVGTLITLLISAMCGYALAIYRFEIKYVNLVFGVFLLGTLIPGETLTVPQFSVISAMGLYNNIWGVILPVVTTTTGIFMYRQHYMSLPLSLVEAARIDGASEWKIFSNIMLPLGSNVTITLTIFSFMWRWNDYILPLLVLSDQKKYTIQIAIKNFIGNTGVDWSSILAASVLSILPIVILFVILQKYIVGGVSAGGVKG